MRDVGHNKGFPVPPSYVDAGTDAEVTFGEGGEWLYKQRAQRPENSTTCHSSTCANSREPKTCSWCSTVRKRRRTAPNLSASQHSVISTASMSMVWTLTP